MRRAPLLPADGRRDGRVRHDRHVLSGECHVAAPDARERLSGGEVDVYAAIRAHALDGAGGAVDGDGGADRQLPGVLAARSRQGPPQWLRVREALGRATAAA